MPTNVFWEQNNYDWLRDTKNVTQIKAHSKHDRNVDVWSLAVRPAWPQIKVWQAAYSTINSTGNAFCHKALSGDTWQWKCTACCEFPFPVLYKGIVVMAISASSWSIVGAKVGTSTKDQKISGSQFPFKLLLEQHFIICKACSDSVSL